MYKNPMEQYMRDRSEQSFLRDEERSLRELAMQRIGRDVADSLPVEEQQVGGDHYKTLKIQPFRYIHANGIPFAEGCIIKYVTRWRSKGGLEDLRKARHMLDLLIDAESDK